MVTEDIIAALLTGADTELLIVVGLMLVLFRRLSLSQEADSSGELSRETYMDEDFV